MYSFYDNGDKCPYVGIIGFIGMVIPQLIRKWQWKQSLGRQLALNIVIGGTNNGYGRFYW